MARILDLPSELLLDIIKLSTYSPARDIDTLVSYPRFSSAYATSAKKQCKDALRTKAALSAVCSTIRSMVLEFLYEDIWIRHGSDGLLEALESSGNVPRLGLLGGYVKRVSLSLSLAVDGGGSKTRRRSRREMYEIARRILLVCPNVRALSRPPEEEDDEEEAAMTSLPIDDLDLPLLERVDWYNTPFGLPFANSPSPKLIWTSNSLRVLILGADNFPDLSTPGDNADGDADAEDSDARTTINLPNLHTLGIRALNTFSTSHTLHRSHTLHLPSLRRLILGRPEAIYNFYTGALAPLAHHVTHIELESHEPRFLRHDFVSTLLGYCPNVVELGFPVGTTRPVYRRNDGEELLVPPRVVEEYKAMRRVYLHTGFPSSSSSSSSSVGGESGDSAGSVSPAVYDQKGIPWWTLLAEHFEGLCGSRSRFSGLEQIVLCGEGEGEGEEWKETVGDGRFEGLVRIARMRGVRVEY